MVDRLRGCSARANVMKFRVCTSAVGVCKPLTITCTQPLHETIPKTQYSNATEIDYLTSEIPLFFVLLLACFCCFISWSLLLLRSWLLHQRMPFAGKLPSTWLHSCFFRTGLVPPDLRPDCFLVPASIDVVLPFFSVIFTT